MYAVLGEAQSDANTIKELVRRISRNPAPGIKTKGYTGGGELKRKGAKQIQLFKKRGCSRFVISYDADRADPTEKRREIEKHVVSPSGVAACCCIVVPVQEIEAWILADLGAVTNVFTGWHPEPVNNPESIQSPKEYLERLSAEGVARPRYAHAVHNEKVARYLNLDRVRRECPSFEPLYSFVRND